MPLRRLIPCLVLGLLAALPLAPPAWAAPAQVGLVSFVAASTTSLTLSWPQADGASAYEIRQSSHVDMSSAATVKTTSATTATISGLATGQTYCFQVRARNGTSFGLRSAHTCKPTIRAQAPIGGTLFAVMTLNACSQVCSGWSSRHAAVNKVIETASRNPDVIAAQEAGAWTIPPPGYAIAVSKSAKVLFYQYSRFTLATSAGSPRAGYITLSKDPGRYAVWAELIEKSTSKRIIFVSAHTAAAADAYVLRGQEIKTLLASMNGINTGGDPVVYAGDFNSQKNRGTYSESIGFGAEDTVGRTFAASGYYDAYDLARTLRRPNWSSYHGLKTTPTISWTWGDHVDHVFVKPASTNIWRWMNASLYTGTSYASPLPSDHSPVQVDLYIR
jgi:endonuclease/exonuclease/phosphatase family metal-dependent hydrolase